MRNFTIKVLILLLVVFFAPNATCSVNYNHISDKCLIMCSKCHGTCDHASCKLLTTCRVLAATAVVGVIGGVLCKGCQVANYMTSFCQKIKNKMQGVCLRKEDLEQ